MLSYFIDTMWANNNDRIFFTIYLHCYFYNTSNSSKYFAVSIKDIIFALIKARLIRD